MDSEQKRAAIREYKERKVPRGVFAIRCEAAGRHWVGAWTNLDAIRNRQWFTLRNGSHRNRGLQEAWNTYGENAFEFQILETLTDDVSPLAAGDLLKDRLGVWLSRAGAEAL